MGAGGYNGNYIYEKEVNDKINSNNSAECTIVAVFFFTINEKNKKNCTDNIIYY